MDNNRPIITKKPLITKKPVAPKVEPKQLELKAGLVSKSGMWMIEGLRESDGNWIICPSKENTKAFGRIPMDVSAATALMEK